MRTRSSDLTIASPKTRFVQNGSAITVPPLFLHIFEEDVSLRVAPIGGRRFNKQFNVVLEGEEYQQERARAVFQLLTDTESKGIEAIVADSIKQIAVYLLNDGVAVFELLAAQRDERKDFVVLHSVQPEYLYRLPLTNVQVIPRTEWTKDGPRYSFIPKDRFWTFTFPAVLGGRAGYLRMRRVLSRMTGFPTFFERELSKGEFTTQYDSSEFRRLMRTTMLRATRTWGWIGRDHSLDYETEFYSAYRQITFAWATATLREAIVSGFNRLYVRLGIHTNLRLEGLLAPDDILEIRRQFASGEIDIAKAFERLTKCETAGGPPDADDNPKGAPF